MDDDFEITFFSDSDYEEITVEVSFRDQIFCQLNKDKGPDNIEVEFFADARILAEKNAMKFSLDDFLKVIAEASDALKES
ncbi:hypothetical protein J2X14_003035 [Pantoea alhagi]|uniref:hypothetical protein n=1 Tax=Mixta sp. BE291 TaxID=3158787 RepID=UPI0028659437|nr:hypothetical protein [Pantoea alhagi]